MPAAHRSIVTTTHGPLRQRRPDFRTPLHVAAEAGHFEAAKRLIELGADVNAVAKVSRALPRFEALANVAGESGLAPKVFLSSRPCRRSRTDRGQWFIIHFFSGLPAPLYAWVSPRASRKSQA